MGLFDGRLGRRTASSTAPPRTSPGCCDAPVVLVVDAAAQAPVDRRPAPRVRALRPAGALGRRHPQPRRLRAARRGCCAAALRRGRRCPCSASLRRAAELAVPSPAPRAGHRPPSTAPRRATRWPRWPRWWPPTSTSTPSRRLARRAPATPAAPWDPRGRGRRRPPTARPPSSPWPAAPAFTFGYAEHAELLAAAGARSSPSTRCTTRRCPRARAGLVLGGGFPEEHARPSSPRTRRCATAVRRFAARRRPDRTPSARGLLYLGRIARRRRRCAGCSTPTPRWPTALTLGLPARRRRRRLARWPPRGRA